MANVKLYLDVRYKRHDGYRLTVMLIHKGHSALIPLGIMLQLNEWDKTRSVVINRPDKNRINSFLRQKIVAYEHIILDLSLTMRIGSISAVKLKDMIVRIDEGGEAEAITFKSVFDKFVQRHENERTRQIYLATWIKIEKFDKNAEALTFSDITRNWLQDFFYWMSKDSPSVNARNIHLRNIRAVFNDAIEDGITNEYPFRKLKIRPEETAKRNLTVTQLRYIFNAEVEDFQVKYIDLFKLSFYLIGINIGDLLRLPANALHNGRIEYRRAKTHKLYSVKVEPEAMELINKYHGTQHLLNFLDPDIDYRAVAWRINKALKEVMPGVTTYWARHTWASLASEIDIPEDVISRALGHATSGAAVTRIYINFNHKKIDDANRAVIDYVLKRN